MQADNTQQSDTNQNSLSIKDMLDQVQLGDILDQALEGFQVIDRNWRYVYVNRTVAEQGKTTKDALLGRTMMEMYPGIEKTPLFEKMKQVMEQKVSTRFENEFSFPDGSVGWYQLFIHPWSNGIMIFSIDITDRKKIEETLAKKIEQLDSVDLEAGAGDKITELKNILVELKELSLKND